MCAMAVMNITSAWYSGIQRCRSDMGPTTAQAFGVGCRRTNVGGSRPHDDLYIVISNGLRPGCVPGAWRSVANPGTASMRLQALTSLQHSYQTPMSLIFTVSGARYSEFNINPCICRRLASWHILCSPSLPNNKKISTDA
jgi:hypothetical protein